MGKGELSWKQMDRVESNPIAGSILAPVMNANTSGSVMLNEILIITSVRIGELNGTTRDCTKEKQ